MRDGGDASTLFLRVVDAALQHRLILLRAHALGLQVRLRLVGAHAFRIGARMFVVDGPEQGAKQQRKRTANPDPRVHRSAFPDACAPVPDAGRHQQQQEYEQQRQRDGIVAGLLEQREAAGDAAAGDD